jgi:hypothetical protein
MMMMIYCFIYKRLSMTFITFMKRLSIYFQDAVVFMAKGYIRVLWTVSFKPASRKQLCRKMISNSVSRPIKSLVTKYVQVELSAPATELLRHLLRYYYRNQVAFLFILSSYVI